MGCFRDFLCAPKLRVPLETSGPRFDSTVILNLLPGGRATTIALRHCRASATGNSPGTWRLEKGR